MIIRVHFGLSQILFLVDTINLIFAEDHQRNIPVNIVFQCLNGFRKYLPTPFYGPSSKMTSSKLFVPIFKNMTIFNHFINQYDTINVNFTIM